MDWDNGLQSEIDFWNQWFRTGGLDWPEDYRSRLDPNTEIQDNVAIHLVTGNERILDVGAGPLTLLGKLHQGKPLDITACDALADVYAGLIETYGIIPLVLTEQCLAEALVKKYGQSQFDLVHAQNCIDHCSNPLTAIIQMVSVVIPGGKVILRHEENEGKNEGYTGLHQWDFYANDGDFMVSGKGETWNITQLLSTHAEVETVVEDGYICNIITKLQ